MIEQKEILEYQASIKTDTLISVRCFTCKSVLAIAQTGKYQHDQYTLSVIPCAKCMDESYRDGFRNCNKEHGIKRGGSAY